MVFIDDPEYNVPVRQYRNFLLEPNRYKRVGTLSDPKVEAKIHQTFRAQYLKDVVLARIIEEAHYSVITSIIMFNQVDILTALSKDEAFLNGLFAELRDHATSRERKKTILLFIQDFCGIARNIQMVNRQSFYRTLAANGIFQELPHFFYDTEYSMRMVVTDIFISILDHDASLLRSFVLAQHKHGSRGLTEVIIEALIQDPDDGMKFQYVEMLRMLMDWSNVEAADVCPRIIPALIYLCIGTR